MIDMTLRQLLARTKENQRIVLEIHDGDEDEEEAILIQANCKTLNMNLISRTLNAMISTVYAYNSTAYITVYIPKTPWLEDEEKDEEDEHEAE